MSLDMSKKRTAIHAFLSNDAHAAWHDFAGRNGVSVSALLELMPEMVLNKKGSKIDAIVAEARSIDAARRRRVDA